MSRCEDSLRREAGDRDFYALSKERLGVTQVVADAVVSAAGAVLFFSGHKQTATLKNAARAFCWFTLSNIAFNLVNNGLYLFVHPSRIYCLNFVLAFALRESTASVAAADFGLLLGHYQRLDRIVAEHARWWDAMSMLSADVLLSASTDGKQSPWDLIVQQYQSYHGEVCLFRTIAETIHSPSWTGRGNNSVIRNVWTQTASFWSRVLRLDNVFEVSEARAQHELFIFFVCRYGRDE